MATAPQIGWACARAVFNQVRQRPGRETPQPLPADPGGGGWHHRLLLPQKYPAKLGTRMAAAAAAAAARRCLSLHSSPSPSRRRACSAAPAWCHDEVQRLCRQRPFRAPGAKGQGRRDPCQWRRTGYFPAAWDDGNVAPSSLRNALSLLSRRAAGLSLSGAHRGTTSCTVCGQRDWDCGRKP